MTIYNAKPARPLQGFFARSVLGRALWRFRREFVWVGVFSFFVNLLALTPTLYMLQVFDRVMVSGSGLTLIGLTAITVGFFLCMGFAEWVRSRLLVGLWPTASGKVRLDGVDVFGWNKAELGPHVGYLPQNVELFDGTIAENIARFGVVERDKVRDAVTLVGMDSWIDSLPDGLDTRIGEDGASLSGGQRQRVALARAVFGNPKLLVLDEPNASLDEAGEQALVAMLNQMKQRGATVLVVTHRTSVLPACDKLLMLRDGQVAAYGPRDEVLAQLREAATAGANAGASAPTVRVAPGGAK